MLHRPNKTRGAKEGVIEPGAADLIRPFVAGPDEPPRYALHFGTVDKVGVNPTSKYNTPLAVCAYPLTEEIFDQFLRIDLPFAQKDAKYLFVLEIKPNARVFYSTERFFDLGVGSEYLGADLSKIEINSADDTTIAEIRRSPFSKQFFYSTRPSGYYRNKQYFVEGGTAARAAQWGHKLWKMGIDVWVDADREGILHRAEPSQVMFFNPSSYHVVLSMDNPKNTLQARFGRDWRRRKGIDLTGADLLYANLNGADLSGAKLIDAQLIYAKLIDANLNGADLSGAKLIDANLNGADLTAAILSGANLTAAILSGAKLIKANLSGANLRGANLTGADLTGADLKLADLRDVQYDESTTWPDSTQDVLRVWRRDKNLTGAVLTGENLTGADLPGADLSGADLSGADLRDADLSGADLSGADLTGADLRGADLRYANLTGADLTGAKLYGAMLDGADLTRADLTRAKLTFAYLSRAKLPGADLRGADLIGAYLYGADLTGADLTGADPRRAVLDGIIYDDSTIWPSGFTPPPSAPRQNRR